MSKIKGSSQTFSEYFERIPSNRSCYLPINLSNKKADSKKPINYEVKIRRTERIERRKPNYYDILEYERQNRREKKQKARAKAKLVTKQQAKNNKSKKEVNSEFKLKRMHLKTKKAKKKKSEITSPKEEELEEIVLTKETIAKFDLILQDINRKIYASSWRVYT